MPPRFSPAFLCSFCFGDGPVLLVTWPGSGPVTTVPAALWPSRGLGLCRSFPSRVHLFGSAACVSHRAWPGGARARYCRLLTRERWLLRLSGDAGGLVPWRGCGRHWQLRKGNAKGNFVGKSSSLVTTRVLENLLQWSNGAGMFTFGLCSKGTPCILISG